MSKRAHSADAASTTKVAVPEMIKRGYSPAFSCAITAVSSILPNIIPPAIAMLVYVSVSNVSISRLFAAGIVPRLPVAMALMVVVYILAVRRGYEGGKTRAPVRVVWSSFLQAAPTLAIALLILGCIRLGITTASEVGVFVATVLVVLAAVCAFPFLTVGIWDFFG
ncbi:TRAP transporter large permease subunit [Azospirillum sp. YIM B02556]|uniref:TRAP transporter large permease subunit n=2 Tax=Azospirillum endophyticum TaxID=2800326 RepID=A0ABS1F3W2_9PROT|nr:TRAP transporter large permease subunit [Azospirillum endophyticum]